MTTKVNQKDPIKCEAVLGTANNRKDVNFTESSNIIDEWPHNWPDGEITYRLNNLTKDISKEAFQHRAVTVALRMWQLRISKLKFRRERNPDVSVDFDVSFAPQQVFASKNVLAHAYFPGQGKISGDCEINDEWDWVSATRYAKVGRPPLVPVLCHEFGHSLGLRHNPEDRTAIMFPSFSISDPRNDLGINDINRIQARYGKRKIPQRIIDYFKRRRDLALDFR